MPLNFFITAEVLSWVITWSGRMERKSPARSGRLGPSAMWACAIFSTMVWPMSMTSRCRGPIGLEQLHQLGHARLLLQAPDGVHGAAADFARHHRLRQG